MFGKNDFKRVKTEFARWWNGEQKKPMLQILCPDSKSKPNKEEKFSGPACWEVLKYSGQPKKVLDAFEKWTQTQLFVGENYPNFWPNLGAGVTAAYFTGYLKFDSEVETVWFEHPLKWKEISDVLKINDNNSWWKYTKDLITEAGKRYEGNYAIATTDLGGILDILASLRGTQSLLFDIIDEPEYVQEAQDSILKLWFYAYDELYKHISQYFEGASTWMGLWCPKRYFPLQCDFSAMISPSTFEVIVEPYLRKQAKYIEHSIYHLDGPGELAHLDMILNIQEIDGIQWVPSPNDSVLDDKFINMYERIQEKGKLLVLQHNVVPERVPEFFEKISSDGVLLTINCESEKQAYELLNWRSSKYSD